MKLLDGGFGTTLKSHFGVEETDIGSLQPIVDGQHDIFTKCHQLFLDAGCEIITTGNYKATPHYLTLGGLSTTLLPEYLKKIGEIAFQLKSTNPKTKIAGCLPPLGENFHNNFFHSVKQLTEHYNLTAKCLYPYCDFFLAETITTRLEANLVYQTLHPYDKPIYLSFCISQDGETLPDGTSIYRVLKDLKYNITGIMFNCSPITYVDQALKKMVIYRSLHQLSFEIGAYPNRYLNGLNQPDQEKHPSPNKYNEVSISQFSKYVKQWDNLGVDIIGGCCGISPDHLYEVYKYKVL